MFLSFFKCFFRCCLRDTTTECDNLGVIEVEAATLDTTQNKTKFRQEIIGNVVPQTNNCLREDGFPQYLDQVSTCCQGCGQAFSSNVKSLAYNPFSHGHCYSCTRILREIKKLDIPGRLNRFTKNGAIYIEHEAKFMNYLHQHKTQSHAELMEGSFYHLPLSTNYYRKQMDETTGLYTKFVYHKSFPEENNVSHFINCNGCKNFVATKRRTLIKTTRYARTRYKICISSHVASSNDLFALMVNSNCICELSGVQGVWITTPGYPDYSFFRLSLDHRLPLSKGGSSYVDNLQVSLQFFNNFKGSHDHEEFQNWFNGFMRKQGLR